MPVFRRRIASPEFPVVPQTRGVLLVRDSIDVTPLVLAHHLVLGLEHIHVIDDGSTDGTTEFLDVTSERTERVTFDRVLGEDDPKWETVSDACNRLISRGQLDIYGRSCRLVPEDRSHRALTVAGTFLESLGLPVP